MDQLRHQLMAGVRPARLLFGALAVALVAGCESAPEAQATPGPEPTIAAALSSPPGEGGAPYSLDSALTLFRRGLDTATELRGGSRSIGALVTTFHQAVLAADTAALRAMAMNRAEFAWVYYPGSEFTRAPTKQEPGLVWFLHLQNSAKGATRLLNRLARTDLRIVRNACRAPRTMGATRLWDDCVQTIALEGDTVAIRLFGGVVERQGRYKIFSYANDL